MNALPMNQINAIVVAILTAPDERTRSDYLAGVFGDLADRGVAPEDTPLVFGQILGAMASLILGLRSVPELDPYVEAIISAFALHAATEGDPHD